MTSIEERALYITQSEHALYTDEVRMIVLTTMQALKCAEASDEVIDAVWADGHFRLLNQEASALAGVNTDAAGNEQLTEQGRSAIRDYLINSGKREDELIALDERELCEQYDELYLRKTEQKRALAYKNGRERDAEAFFNEPRARAVWDNWLNRPFWTPAEAVALSLGKDPSKVRPKRLKPYVKVAVSPFTEEFGRRIDSLKRALAARDKQLKGPLTPTSFARWALKEGWPDLPAPLLNLAPRRAPAEDPRELNTSYKILAGILEIRYNLITDPTQSNVNETILQISHDLEDAGITISKPTLEKHLRKAVAMVEGKRLKLRKRHP